MNTVESAKILMKRFSAQLLDLAFIAGDDESIPLDERQWLYNVAPSMYAKISQDLGVEYVIEGKVTVYNAKAMIKIGDFPMAKYTKFDLQAENGEWGAGYLDKGAYGMYFAGEKQTVILTGGMNARVSFPLEIKER
ncbi:MAG: hypothetical protein LBG43_02265 [Treponema sp.]|jgi:hypothetical protein|nr:hypothetical protein [Treponema sp.]